MRVQVVTNDLEVIEIVFDSDDVYHDIVTMEDIEFLTIAEVGTDREFNIELIDVKFWIYGD